LSEDRYPLFVKTTHNVVVVMLIITGKGDLQFNVESEPW
jgi:hypothetical protein